ncbi:MAG: hypothetical protein UT69_C0014G0010 [Candidatus Yanofskybacteria bacterium GW2011_GWE1_40_10]|nr:MAG: hypothetical protein UT69_C0014G0010 [Candidatus Yanofskybacteria bacterium GW2011_GWE1_40_10]
MTFGSTDPKSVASANFAILAHEAKGWWAQLDLNQRPADYEPAALTN